MSNAEVEAHKQYHAQLSQPPMSTWKFIEELKKPLHDFINLTRSIPKESEVDLSKGVSLEFSFPDVKKLLETAYDDFRCFLNAVNISADGRYKIIIKQSETDCFEAYKINISETCCKIQANDTEGVRRALVYLEDEILRANGLFLTRGTIERKPFIKTRISRCFFGPIKRPPLNRDELADDINYYPDEYLNRLAHEGINALWLTVSFKDLCPSAIFAGQASDSEKRLRKLRKTVNQCARYGIKIYLFCIEPGGFMKGEAYQSALSTFKKFPELAGHEHEVVSYFCTSSSTGQRYLENCTFHIFSKVPDLGGLIDITLGEGPTNCYSFPNHFFNNNCPRCSRRKPWEVFIDIASALARGMQKANPAAEMISWLYIPYLNDQEYPVQMTMDVIKEIAAHTPKNVTFQYNFESMGKVNQLGNERMALDYWLAWPGPSEIFRETAEAAIKNGARASAKIQVGCSHEVASIPFVPVPGNLYQKYKAMHEIGITTVMQCWYFGNYPGLMNKAAGELSFLPFPESEKEFLLKLARIDWNENAEKVVKAWKCFQESYSNFPVNLSFIWYGPIHNSVVWPLYLYPVDKPISPSWSFTFPLDSGDRIGECICYDHTLEDTLELLGEMDKLWSSGVKQLKNIEMNFSKDSARLLDIGLCKALGIQINSSNNIFKFYALREKLPRLKKEKKLKALEAMRKIVKAEIKNSDELKKLCQSDSRLGFHSEAEGYKYFPEKLEWRKIKLQNLLENDFKKLQQEIKTGKEIFPEYTGAKPNGKIYIASRTGSGKEKLESGDILWQAYFDDENIYFKIEGTFLKGDQVSVEIEPCRLWPSQRFMIKKSGNKLHYNFKTEADKSWDAIISTTMAKFRIPFNVFEGYYEYGNAMKINIHVNEISWVQGPPWEYRLKFLTANPSNLGWLFFDRK